MLFVSLWSVRQANTVNMNTLPMVGNHLLNYTDHIQKAAIMKLVVFQHLSRSFDVSSSQFTPLWVLEVVLRGSKLFDEY
jgi:hypothetical protein